MRILILDDDATRLYTFSRNLQRHDVTRADTIDDFVRAMRSGPHFDIIYLDHDLNDFGERSVWPGMYGPQKLTGVDACNFMLNQVPRTKWPKQFVIHSWNQSGAIEMARVLKRTGIPIRIERFHSQIGR